MVDYWKVPLILSLFKVYTAILAERLKKEVKEKRIILQNFERSHTGATRSSVFGSKLRSDIFLEYVE